MDINKFLFQKYDKPTSKYIIYPSYANWNKSFSQVDWEYLINNNVGIKTKKRFSVYINLPYCENNCYFCNCNKFTANDHEVEIPYITTLLKEWEKYVSFLPNQFEMKSIHLGAGNPGFFSPKNLSYFLNKFLSYPKTAPDHNFSVEVHPAAISAEHLSVLAANGFNQLTLCVQDFNKEFQKFSGKNQSFEDVSFCVSYAKELGFKSINFKLIYGAPKQLQQSVEETLKFITQIKPDSILLSRYEQISSEKNDTFYLPSVDEKFKIFQKYYSMFLKNGYKELGLGKFVLESNPLYKLFLDEKLYSNFIGYTNQSCPVLIGLGVSAISDFDSFYVQNKNSIQEYLSSVSEDNYTFEAGYILTTQDYIIRKHILNLICYRKTSLKDLPIKKELEEKILNNLNLFVDDKIISITDGVIIILPSGVPFLQNICSCFQVY